MTACPSRSAFTTSHLLSVRASLALRVTGERLQNKRPSIGLVILLLVEVVNITSHPVTRATGGATRRIQHEQISEPRMCRLTSDRVTSSRGRSRFESRRLRRPLPITAASAYALSITFTDCHSRKPHVFSDMHCSYERHQQSNIRKGVTHGRLTALVATPLWFRRTGIRRMPNHLQRRRNI
jgi:hypothetical protein